MERRSRIAARITFALTTGLTAACCQSAAAPPAANAAAPLSFKIGNVEFTPGGFLDLTTVWRSNDVGSGIGTNFAALPYNDTPAGRVGELRESAQYSRVMLKAAGRHDHLDITTYFEGDFLGNQPTNVSVTSNSATFRLRVFFVNIKHGAWELLAGQAWSLLTPNRFETSTMPGDYFISQDMDANFQVGLTWARQPQFRLTYHASQRLTAAISAEEPDQYVGGSAGAGTVVLPGGTGGVYAGQVDSGAGSYSSPGFSPDVIAKLAYDTGEAAGQGIHLEVSGLESTYRVYTPAGNSAGRAVGGGLSANAIACLTPRFHLIATDFVGDGGGRYFFGAAPDFIITQGGTISPLRSGGAILGFEAPVTPAWLLYGYYGGEEIGRDFDASPSQFSGGPTPVGYGYAGSSNNDNRTIQEGTFGVIQTLFQSRNDGALQIITQGSYLTRAPWYVLPGAPKNAHTTMVFADLRYVLP